MLPWGQEGELQSLKMIESLQMFPSMLKIKPSMAENIQFTVQFVLNEKAIFYF